MEQQYQIVLSARDTEKGTFYFSYLEHPFGLSESIEGVRGLGDLAFLTEEITNRLSISPISTLGMNLIVTRRPTWPSEKHYEGQRELSKQELLDFSKKFLRLN